MIGVLLLSLLSDGSSARLRHAWALPSSPLPVAGFLPYVRDQVQKAYDRALANPSSAEACGELGMVLHAYKQYEVASAWYQRARLLEPESIRWAYYLALTQQATGRIDEAVVNLKDVLYRTDYTPARIALADLLLVSHNFDESRRLYEAVLEREPFSAAPHYGLAQVLSTQGKIAAAVEHYEKAVRYMPDFGAAHYALVVAYRSLGATGKVERHLLLYQRNPGGEPVPSDPLLAAVSRLNIGPSIFMRRADRLIGAGRLAEAANELEHILSLEPGYEPAHTGLIALYAKLGQWTKAEYHYREAIVLAPGSIGSHVNFGLLLLEQERFAEAAQALQRALEINPRDARAHTLLGRALDRQGATKEAVRHYRLAVEYDPSYREAHYLLGMRLLADGNRSEGLTHLERTLTPMSDKTPAFARELAKAHARVGNRERAIAYLLQAKKQADWLGQADLEAAVDQDLRALQSTSGRR